MDEPQIIKTPAGEELVVLPRQDYDALVDALAEAEEELADIAVLDQRKAEIGAGSVPHLPAEVSALLLKGETRIAALRIWRGMSPSRLSEAAEVDAAVLADLEAGRSRPSTEVVERLARVLDVSSSWLVP